MNLFMSVRGSKLLILGTYIFRNCCCIRGTTKKSFRPFTCCLFIKDSLKILKFAKVLPYADHLKMFAILRSVENTVTFHSWVSEKQSFLGEFLSLYHILSFAGTLFWNQKCISSREGTYRVYVLKMLKYRKQHLFL